MYQIIRCFNCGTPQYIRKGQQTRTCPRCHTKIQCPKAKVFTTAETEMEANQIIRSMKTPSEIEQRMARLKAKIAKPGTAKTNTYSILGDLITELSAIFPKAIPAAEVFSRAKKLGLDDEEFINKILDELNTQGLMLKNKDFRGNTILQFPSIPFSMGKLHVKRPIPRVLFNRQKWDTPN